MSNTIERRRFLAPDDSPNDLDAYTEINYCEVEKSKKKHGFTRNLAFAIASCVLGSSFQYGYNTGVVNSPELIIQQFYNESNFQRHGSYLSVDSITLLWAFTVSIFTVGGMVGGVSAGYWGNRYGRKGALLRNNILAVIAAGLLGFAKLASSFEMLMVGRFISGINAGINTGLAPLYLSEIAPVSLRGMAGTFNQLAIVLAVLVSQILGLKIALGTRDLWPLCMGLTVAPVIFQFLTLPFCPESPRFLMLSQQDEQQAEEALIWLRRNDDVLDELSEMHLEREDQKNIKKFTVCDLFRFKQLRSPLIISLVLQLSQQLSGINAVIYYSTSLFMDAGLSHELAQYATVGSAVVNVCMTFISALLMDHAGRRTLHLYGLGGMFIFASVLSYSLIFQDHYSWLSYVCVAAVILYIISFATGPGSIPWFYVAELFAQGPRSAAVSIAVLTNWAANFVVALVYPIVQKATQEYSFIPFVVLLAVFWLYTYLKVPETKGKTIDEITKAFSTDIYMDKANIGDISVEDPLLNEAHVIQ